MALLHSDGASFLLIVILFQYYRCKICLAKRPFTGLTSLLSHLNGQEHEKSRKKLSLMHFSPNKDSIAGQLGPPVSLPTRQTPPLTQISQVPLCVPNSHIPYEPPGANPPISSVQLTGSYQSKSSFSLSDDGKETCLLGYGHPSQSPPRSFIDVPDHLFYEDISAAEDLPSSLQWYTSDNFYIPRTPLFATPEVCTCVLPS